MNIKFMEKAIDIAQNSGTDLPVGAVIVKNGEIIAATNQKGGVGKTTIAGNTAYEEYSRDGCIKH